MEEEGVNVVYGVPDYKVHSKICLVKRTEKGKAAFYACLSTGNFNEKTAVMYSDHTLLTADKRLTDDLIKVFKALLKSSLAKGDFSALSLVG